MNDTKLQPPAIAESRGLSWGSIALVAPAPTVGVIAGMIIWPNTTLGATMFFLAKCWMFALPLYWFLVVQKQRISFSPIRNGGMVLGIVIGIVLSLAIGAAFFLLPEGTIDVELLRRKASDHGIGTLPQYLGVCAYWILVNSLLEEFVYRWFLVTQGERVLSRNGAIVLSAACFVVHHVIALALQTGWVIVILANIGVFAGGIIWSWLYARTQSIWPGYISHAIVDIAIFTIGWWLIFGSAT